LFYHFFSMSGVRTIVLPVIKIILQNTLKSVQAGPLKFLLNAGSRGGPEISISHISNQIDEWMSKSLPFLDKIEEGSGIGWMVERCAAYASIGIFDRSGLPRCR